MTVEERDREELSRRRVVFAYAVQGVAGFVLLCALTYTRWTETGAIVRSLGGSAPLLVVILFAFCLSLALLKFSVTEMVFVSLVLAPITIMIPILGPVISGWISVATAILARALGILQLGPNKSSLEDPALDYVRIFGQFGTYGIPMVVAGLVYQATGGRPPVVDVSFVSAGRIALAGFALEAMNNLVMVQIERAYGYDFGKILRLSLIDMGLYVPTLFFAMLVTLSYPALRWPGILAWSVVGVLGNVVVRNLALAQARSRELIKRLTSLSEVGRTISLDVSTSELLMAVYEACKPVVDVSNFTIAMVDDERRELVFPLNIRDEKRVELPIIPLGQGLTSSVVASRKPLLIRTMTDIPRLGLKSVVAGEPTESWLGVPMTARDRVVGVIIIQSYRKNRFTSDDAALLTTIANQAAVALVNARLYQDLEAMKMDLENRVAARTAELQETNVHLVAANRTKSQFLANMSHELRTPLNSIIGFSSVLMETTRSLLEPRLYRFVENINTAGGYLLNLIDDILDLSKIEAGRVRLFVEEFDLRETIESVERVMKGTATEANVFLRTSIASDIPRVCLDESRVKQILFNLLSNAIKFSHARGTVTLRADLVLRGESPIGVDAVRLIVSDEGIGIAPDELARVYDQFHQTDEARKRRRQGTGLGLSLTRSFAELMGGTISVESTHGAGTTFTIHLPTKRPVASAPRAENDANDV